MVDSWVRERRASEYLPGMRTALALLAVLLIVLANGFFVAAEYALVTMRRTRVQELVDQGSRGARRVSDLQQNPAHDLKTRGAELVQGVFVVMPIRIVRTVVEID